MNSSKKGILDLENSKFAKLKSSGMDSVELLDGFIKEKFDICRENSLKLLFELMDSEEGYALCNFKISAGLMKGQFKGTNWQDEWVYKWLEAASYVYVATKNEELSDRMDYVIDIVSKAQCEDGYISNQITLLNKPRFQRIVDHELYNMGHLLTAACAHYKATGKDSLLLVAIKTGNYLHKKFVGNPETHLKYFCYNPSQIMGLVELYRITNDKRYLEAANVFIDNRGCEKPKPLGDVFDKNGVPMVLKGTDLTQDRVPLREETQVVGHMVFATYLYCGAADAYMETGDKTLLEVLERLWKDLVYKKSYISGGVAALHKGYSERPNTSGVHRALDTVTEAAGADYELPNATAYNETCDQVGSFMWNYRMLQITGDSKYADVMESTFYNGILSGMDLNGQSWFYTNPLRWYGKNHPLHTKDSFKRFKPNLVDECCPSNVTRTLGGIYNYLYSTAENAIYFNMYSHSRFVGEINSQPISFVQKTNYPWDGKIQIIIDEAPNEEIKLNFRIPEWSNQSSILFNGSNAVECKKGAFFCFEKKLRKGDIIELSLDMSVRLMKANPRAETLRGQAAVMRGPLLYCIEQDDLPEGISVFELLLPRNIKFIESFENSLLGGIVSLNGKGIYICDNDWNDKLYAPIGNDDEKEIALRLIPYYAWNNRGISEMTVWIPLK